MKNIPCTRCLDDHTIRFDELHPECLQAIRDAIEPCLEDEAVVVESGRQYRFVDWEKAFAEEEKLRTGQPTPLIFREEHS